MSNYNEIIKFNKKLIQSDKLSDKKSLVWEDNELYEIEDKRDNNFLEGRFGEFPSERFSTKMGITFIFPIVKSNRKLFEDCNIVDDVSIFEMLSENRVLKIEKIENIEYKNRILNINAIEYLQEINPKERCNVLSIYEGLVETEKNGLMLGRIVFLNGKNGLIYEFTYAGKGNYTDIQMEQRNILKSLARSVKR